MHDAARLQVNNTDAEGRLTLGDALCYAQYVCGVEAVVDAATLTGRHHGRTWHQGGGLKIGLD